MKLQLIILILSAIPTILHGQKWEAFETNKVSKVTITKWVVENDGSTKPSGDKKRVVKGYDQRGDLIYVTTYVTFRNTKQDSTTYKFDSEHRFIELVLYKFSEYDLNGSIVEKQIKMYDENSRETFFSVESNNRKSECTYSYKYDNAKKLIEKTTSCKGTRFPKEVTKYSYDKKGNLISETSSLSSPIEYEIKYSKSGNMVSRLNWSTSKQEIYDVNNNIVEITEPGKKTYFRYDSEKRVIELIEEYQSSITGPDHYQLQYNGKGILIEKKDISKRNNLRPTENWVYNDRGLLTEYRKGTESEKYDYVFY